MLNPLTWLRHAARAAVLAGVRDAITEVATTEDAEDDAPRITELPAMPGLLAVATAKETRRRA